MDQRNTATLRYPNPVSQMGGENVEEGLVDADHSEDSFQALQTAFHEVTRTRMISNSKYVFRKNYQLSNPFPSSGRLVSIVRRALKDTGILPAKVSVQLGYFLKEYKDAGEESEYRFFHPGYNSMVLGETFIILKFSELGKVKKRFESSNFLEKLQNLAGKKSSRWVFIGCACVLVHVYKVGNFLKKNV